MPKDCFFSWPAAVFNETLLCSLQGGISFADLPGLTDAELQVCVSFTQITRSSVFPVACAWSVALALQH